MKDKFGRTIKEGDIVVRPIHSALRVSKVLKVTENKIELSCFREQSSRYDFSFISDGTESLIISNHKEKQVLYKRDIPQLLILKDYDEREINI